jgi:YtkA-like
MMRRMVLIAMAVVTVLAGPAVAAELKTIKTQKAGEVTVSLLSDSGQWTQGKNEFVLSFTRDGKPVDVDKTTLNTSMPMPGMAPMVAGSTLQPDGPGRYRGRITFPDRGERQVTVTWEGLAGKGSTRFSVPVR